MGYFAISRRRITSRNITYSHVCVARRVFLAQKLGGVQALINSQGSLPVLRNWCG